MKLKITIKNEKKMKMIKINGKLFLMCFGEN